MVLMQIQMFMNDMDECIRYVKDNKNYINITLAGI
jgi:hypothetical protein